MIRGLLVLFIMMATLASGGSGDIWTTASSDNARIVDERISRMLDRLSQKSYDSDRDQLFSIFRKTQKEFLHRYMQYSSMDQLAAGEFDCLTATSLFAEILKRSGFSFRIMETNYHIFLLVETEKGEVLIETTDRFEGFIESPAEIAKAIKAYRTEVPTENNSKKSYQYGFEMYNEISPRQLAGLLFFNQAVKAYNESEWLACSEKIALAESHYDSPRVATLASLLVCAISVNEIPSAEKHKVIENLKKIERASPQPVASR
jgi:hypothetical protein